MLLFGHIGYTLAAGFILNSSSVIHNALSKEIIEKPSSSDTSHFKGLSVIFWRAIEQIKGLDLRFVIIGSLLPDIIDKPIGHLFFNNTFGTGVLYTHTLLFTLLLFIAGCIANIYQKNYVLLLAFGTFIHLILDLMWSKPRVLLWPLFGFTFAKSTPIPFNQYLWGLFQQLFNRPWVAIPELVGAVITFWFIWLLLRENKLRSFILNGRVN
jgi:inner membrane protein